MHTYTCLACLQAGAPTLKQLAAGGAGKRGGGGHTHSTGDTQRLPHRLHSRGQSCQTVCECAAGSCRHTVAPPHTAAQGTAAVHICQSHNTAFHITQHNTARPLLQGARRPFFSVFAGVCTHL
jgi:hypothetical protein